MEGWIKLHRRFLNWEWFDNSDMIKLFLYLLLSANHKDSNWKGIEIKRGQLLTGLKSLNNNTNISIQSLRTCLKRLEKTKEINMLTNNHFRIITICNYESYQDEQNTTNKPTNKQLTSNQQATNNKQEYKNKKNENNIYTDVVYFEKSKEIDTAFKDYLKLRIKHKFTMTDRAINALVKKLRELSGGETKKAIGIIENAIVGKWKSFYNE